MTDRPVPSAGSGESQRQGALAGLIAVALAGIPVYAFGLWTVTEGVQFALLALLAWALVWLLAYYRATTVAAVANPWRRTGLAWLGVLTVVLLLIMAIPVSPWLISAILFGVGAAFVLPSADRWRGPIRATVVIVVSVLLVALLPVGGDLYGLVLVPLVALAAFPTILGVDLLLERAAQRQ
jgi:hypothetical protein